MKERLEKFIQIEGLNPSRFAEIMGVQPSSISHLLGGRNKPSYDFIEKFLLRFPKVNPDWLLLGKGQIYRQPPIDPKITDSQEIKISPSQDHAAPPDNTAQPANMTLLKNDLFSPAHDHNASDRRADRTDMSDTTARDSEIHASRPNEPQFSTYNANTPIGSYGHDNNSGVPDNSGNADSSLGDSGSVLKKISGIDDRDIERVVIFLKNKTFISYIPE